MGMLTRENPLQNMTPGDGGQHNGCLAGQVKRNARWRIRPVGEAVRQLGGARARSRVERVLNTKLK